MNTMGTAYRTTTYSQRHRFDDNLWENRFNTFYEELSKTVAFESGSLFVYELNSQSLTEVAKRGDGIDFISAINFPMGTGLSAWVAQKGKVIYLPDIHRGSRHGLNPVRSYLSMPLEMNNRMIGVLNLGHVMPNAFDEPKLSAISESCKEIARKIYNQTYLNFRDDDSDCCNN